MMKTKYLLAAALLSGLAACSNNETENAGTAEDNAALFTGSIEEIHTRAYDQQWENTDQIGITGTSGDKAYTNICYQYGTGSTSEFTAAGEKIYYQNDESVDFTAYYPWDATLTTATTITADTWGQIDQKKFDFLFATAAGSKMAVANFTFTHKMSKLVLIVKAGRDVSYSDVQSAVCSLENFLHEGTFNRITGVATATGNDNVEWAFVHNENDNYNTPTIKENEANGSVAYTLILFPQTFSRSTGNLTFMAKTGDNTYSAEIDLAQVPDNGSANELKPGAQYNITINLNKTGLTVGDSNISGWNEKNDEINAGM